MLGLAALVATLLRFRARAYVVLACVAAMLCAANIASANAQPKTRVWDFSSADALNIRLNAAESPRLHPKNQLARSEHASGSPHAARGASTVLNRTAQALQKFFAKHGADFGLKGNWNPSRAADASRAIHQHINNPAVRAIEGTYRGNPVTHYIDPQSGLNVMAGPGGNFVSGWRLGAEQLEGVLTTGRLF